MYCTDVLVEIHSMYQNLTEGLEEQVYSIQDSLHQVSSEGFFENVFNLLKIN